METTITTRQKYKCHLCNKEYIRKSYYDTHVIYCELLTKTKKERAQVIEQEQETPSMRNLYVMFQQLVKENEKMKSEIKLLKKAMNLSNIKVTLADWLKDNCNPTYIFEDWIGNIVTKQEDLETIFKHNISSCLLEIFVRNMCLHDTKTNPIQCFMEKNNTLFIPIYNTRDSDTIKKIVWTHITIPSFKLALVKIQKKLINSLMVWKDSCEEDISNINSEEGEKYMKILREVISINQKHENRIANYVLKNVYEQFKVSLPSNIIIKK